MTRETLTKMRAYAKRRFDKAVEFHRYPRYAARQALIETEEHYGTHISAKTHGVEEFDEYGGCIYLITGDAYTITVYYRKGRFCVGCWGDLVK